VIFRPYNNLDHNKNNHLFPYRVAKTQNKTKQAKLLLSIQLPVKKRRWRQGPEIDRPEHDVGPADFSISTRFYCGCFYYGVFF